MKQYVKFKQTLKKYARYSSFLSPILEWYLRHKTRKESLPELIRESERFYRILERKKINVILDVGAHNGITGVTLRDRGYQQKVISFEPLSEAFFELQTWSKLAPPWVCYNIALGDVHKWEKIKVLGNPFASSFLNGRDLLTEELKNHGGAQVEKEELVEIKRLDDLYLSLCQESDRVLLKIDTQGYEKKVLEGSLNALRHIRLVKMELSLVEIYEGETLMHEMIAFMESLGYRPILLERGHVSEESLFQMQVDVIFTNLAFERENQT